MNKKGFTLVEVFAVVFVILILPAIFIGLGLWTDRNLEFWISHFKGIAVHVPFWLSMVVSICLNGAAVGLNVLAEIGRFLI